ncbi:hypothetical protein K492DRAFT_167608 [Lichtheimia hyalospora FSU 10163]|nr:hypothetical protein K492DRAFT_167608 [Lichtheimia hyalospora FSU 10163]
MGCCMSYEQEAKVYEVVLDSNGVARRVAKGQGTHLIHVSKHKETRMEQKSDIVLPSSLSSLPRPPDCAYSRAPKMTWNTPSSGRRVSPIIDEKEPRDQFDRHHTPPVVAVQ